MGQGHGSCGGWKLCSVLKDNGQRWRLYQAIVEGEWQTVEQISPKLLTRALFFHTRLTPLHVAALTGQLEVAALLVDRGWASVNCSSCNGGQTPLMLASKSGKHQCVDYLIQRGGNMSVLLLDTSHSRSCLHYAAKGGHFECVQVILTAAKTAPDAESWKFVRFVNLRDSKGVTALDLAARGGYVGTVTLMLQSGALVSASSSNGGGSCTPLHFAARGGSVECVQELLAWGADRYLRDANGHTAYAVARKHNNHSCASLLDPSVAEPLVWPSPCKFMNALDGGTRALLEEGLRRANQMRRNKEHPSACSSGNSNGGEEVQEESGSERICCICLEHPCSISLQDCGHEMCAICILTLCCHSKPNPALPFAAPPACPFCRTCIRIITCTSSATASATR